MYIPGVGTAGGIQMKPINASPQTTTCIRAYRAYVKSHLTTGTALLAGKAVSARNVTYLRQLSSLIDMTVALRPVPDLTKIVH